jgi:hypothetical protein
MRPSLILKIVQCGRPATRTIALIPSVIIGLRRLRPFRSFHCEIPAFRVAYDRIAAILATIAAGVIKAEIGNRDWRVMQLQPIVDGSQESVGSAAQIYQPTFLAIVPKLMILLILHSTKAISDRLKSQQLLAIRGVL